MSQETQFEEAIEVKAVYDPKKSYTWEKDAKISFEASEFGAIFNILVREEKELYEKLAIINVYKDKLKEMVESGVAYEKV